MTFDEMVHRYLDPVEIVRPGAGDSTGDGLGDVAVVTSGGDATQVRLYTAGRVTAPPTAVTTAFGVPVALPLAPAQTVFRAVADMTNDHLDDLLILQRAGDDRYQVWVAPSVGDGFGAPMLWWDSVGSAIPIDPGALVRFAAADFTGDGRPTPRCSWLVVPDRRRPRVRRRRRPRRRRPRRRRPRRPRPTPDSHGDADPDSRDRRADRADRDEQRRAGAEGADSDRAAATAPTPTAPPNPPASASLWVLTGTGSSLEPGVDDLERPVEPRRHHRLRRRRRCERSGRHLEVPRSTGPDRRPERRASATSSSAPGRRRVACPRRGLTYPTSPRRPREP